MELQILKWKMGWLAASIDATAIRRLRLGDANVIHYHAAVLPRLIRIS